MIKKNLNLWRNTYSCLEGDEVWFSAQTASISWACRCEKLLLLVWKIPLPKTGAFHYHELLVLPDKGITMKEWLGSRTFGPAKRTDPRLLSTILWGINLWKICKISRKIKILAKRTFTAACSQKTDSTDFDHTLLESAVKGQSQSIKVKRLKCTIIMNNMLKPA